MFTEREDAYVRSQRLARVATVSPSGQPDVDAVGYRWDGAAFVFGGVNLLATRKAKNVLAGATRVSLIVDDIDASDGGRHPRGIKLHGVAEVTERDGRPVIVSRPTTTWSWGILGPTFAHGNPVFHRIDWVGAD